ncbi:acid phosphatase type 7 [Marchantia polymorpha subsp. ruderalis]|uniref:Purple acid phosphatase n=2 Tax=Marchantia polymorpha TaxID=3197 RepID=A0AAF6BY89_MARPO|nr:hypothetical protein MARPO_0003s0103 [Marchantia polymorpha]BBN16973.1 hypothetical protein Mp_7g10880 [Marchantia polymorpha subsp. ruderalis]|eukprot:PTQ49211.1 hypothetical protein MARPO_0003s0103 [Marchantia polymorpha]
MEKLLSFLVLCIVLHAGNDKQVKSQYLYPNSTYAGVETEYTRPYADLDMHLDEPILAPNPRGGPEQVFLTIGDRTGTAITVSWSSNKPMETLVLYSKEPRKYDLLAKGDEPKRYTYMDYTSGLLHHVTLSNLEYNTKYYYKIGSSNEEFLTFYGDFTTPPAPGPDTAIKFTVVGDLGQTYSSNTTLGHMMESEGQYLLNMGDFSYADDYQPRWDTWGRMMTPYSSKVPSVFTYGNHEIEYKESANEREPFVAATHRFATPWKSSRSQGPLFYSVEIGPVHIVALNSYVSLAKYTPQYKWLKADLSRVNRAVTPWVVIITHAPWYNTYNAHYLEGEVMRNAVEYLARKYHVDAIYSGHVHSYERFKRLYFYEEDNCAPVYVTIGDGGNREGPATKFKVKPQPPYSAFREPSFGHGTLEIFNKTSAVFKWHRNQDEEAVTADVFYLTNVHSISKNCPKPSKPRQPYYSPHLLNKREIGVHCDQHVGFLW